MHAVTGPYAHAPDRAALGRAGTVINGTALKILGGILTQIWFMPMSWSIFCTEKMRLTLVRLPMEMGIAT